jgi:hypothetical protein
MRMGTAVMAGLVCATGAMAQSYYTGFESPQVAASVGGTVITGQDGWYVPVAGSLDQKSFLYTGNTLGFTQNPVGGNQFLAGVSTGVAVARAQQNFPFGSSGQFTVAWDMAAQFGAGGALPTAANLSSFSLNHSTLAAGAFRGFISLQNYVNPADPTQGFKVEFNVFNAAGVATNNQSPGTAWTSLQFNHWYRQYVTFDLTTNLVTQIVLLDLHTGIGTFTSPVGWYLNGGTSTALPGPNAVRFFVGGSAGSTMGWDNLNIVPAPSALALLGLGGLLAARRRR